MVNLVWVEIVPNAMKVYLVGVLKQLWSRRSLWRYLKQMHW